MYENLVEEAVEPGNVRRAPGAVKGNQGAPGIDRMKTGELEAHLQAHWERIRAKLLAETYVPSPVRRGAMVDGLVEASEEGTSQGGPPPNPVSQCQAGLRRNLVSQRRVLPATGRTLVHDA